MSAISDNLIHFLGRSFKESPHKQLGIFKQIIEKGLRTGQTLIKLSGGGGIVNQIICFTDIPLRECSEHTAVYGKFGIGFKKSFVKKVGGNPARYFLDYLPTRLESEVESRGVLRAVLRNQFNFLMKLMEQRAKFAPQGTEPRNATGQGNPDYALYNKDKEVVLTAEDLDSQIQSMQVAFSFDKEMGDLGPARDETREIDLYYKEREWRLVPFGLAIESGAAKKRPDDTVHYYYSFERSDVNMVVVPNEDLRTDVLKYFIGLREDKDARIQRFAEDLLPVINYDDMNQW